DRGPTRLAVLVLVVAGLVASSGRIVAFSQEAFGNTDITPSLAVYLSTGFTLGVVGVAALVYLAVELVRGDLAGEEPRLGWRLGALGLGLITLTVAFNTVILFYPVQPGQVGLSPAVYPIALGEAVGWLGLLVGVALGLPALDEPGEPEGSLTDAGPDDSVG
ncbi:MAG: hypothetical protein ACXWXR_03380, partial [Candidatus Limnocylindrales bacterium]